MYAALTTFDGLAPALLVVVAVSLLAGAVSVAMRALSPRPLGSASVLGGSLVDMTLVFSLLFAAYLVFTPQPESVEHVRLHLGDDLRPALHADHGDLLPWLQLVGNLLLLFPLGALLPLRSGWLDGPTRVAVAAVLTAVLVEIVQFLLVEGRVVSTDDVVLNTVGATAGAVVSTLLVRRCGVEAAESGPRHDATGQGRYPVWWLMAEVEREGAHRARTCVTRTRSGLR